MQIGMKLEILIPSFKYFWTVMAKNKTNLFVRFLGESMARQSALGFIDLYNHNVNCLRSKNSLMDLALPFLVKNKVRQCFPIRKAREFFARKWKIDNKKLTIKKSYFFWLKMLIGVIILLGKGYRGTSCSLSFRHMCSLFYDLYWYVDFAHTYCKLNSNHLSTFGMKVMV